MKAYVEFYYTNTHRYENGKFVECSPYHIPALGSDGILALDARLSLTSMVSAAKARIKSFEKINKNYSGFKIHKGDLKNSRVIYDSFEVERNERNNETLMRMRAERNIVLEQFVKSYLAAAAWCTVDSHEENDEFTKDSILKAQRDCNAFIICIQRSFTESRAKELLSLEVNKDGICITAHDFWLTRNRHGSGFWDKAEIYGKEDAATLTDLAHKFNEEYVEHVRGPKSKLTFL